LVKLRVCPAHALQLNYKKDKEVLKEQQKRRRQESKRSVKRAKRRKQADSLEVAGSASPTALPRRPATKSTAATEEGGSLLEDTHRGRQAPELPPSDQQEMDAFLNTLLL